MKGTKGWAGFGREVKSEVGRDGGSISGSARCQGLAQPVRCGRPTLSSGAMVPLQALSAGTAMSARLAPVSLALLGLQMVAAAVPPAGAAPIPVPSASAPIALEAMLEPVRSRYGLIPSSASGCWTKPLRGRFKATIAKALLLAEMQID